VGIVGAVGVLILILMNKLHWYDDILILLNRIQQSFEAVVKGRDI
jgi:hypothetical protein